MFFLLQRDKQQTHLFCEVLTLAKINVLKSENDYLLENLIGQNLAGLYLAGHNLAGQNYGRTKLRSIGQKSTTFCPAKLSPIR